MLEVAGYYYLGFVLFGNPHRHAPELDFIMLLAVGRRPAAFVAACPIGAGCASGDRGGADR